MPVGSTKAKAPLLAKASGPYLESLKRFAPSVAFLRKQASTTSVLSNLPRLQERSIIAFKNNHRHRELLAVRNGQ
jgi:hypothetical protein